MQHKNKSIGNYNFTGNILIDTLTVISQYKSAYRLEELTSYTTYSKEQFEAAKTALIELKILSKNGALKRAIKDERYSRIFESTHFEVPEFFGEIIVRYSK